MMSRIFAILAVVLLLAAAGLAATTYTYTGQNYVYRLDSAMIDGQYETSMRVTLSFSLPAPLEANLSSADLTGQLLGFSFADGRNSGTDAFYGLGGTASFLISTDAAGAINGWRVHLGTLVRPDLLLTIDTISGASGGDYATMERIGHNWIYMDEGYVYGPSLGTWSSVTSEGPPSPPAEQAGRILAFLEMSSGNGGLAGTGTERSAPRRLDAFRKMISNAGAFIVAGNDAAACNQLGVAYKKTDGSARPPDLVTGEAAAKLARMIAVLEDALQCSP